MVTASVPAEGDVPAELLRQTEIAIDALEPCANQEYREAMEIIPGIVQVETPLSCYIRASNNDPLQAAQRVTKFWKIRKEKFGERWLLPMTQTSLGALNDVDIQMVQSGWCILIRTSKGLVMYQDISRAADVFATAERLGLDPDLIVDRAVMYFAVVWAHEISTHDMRVCYPVTSRRRPKREFRRELFQIVYTVLPIRRIISPLIVASSFEDGKMELIDFLRYQTAVLLTFNTGGKEPSQLHETSVGKTIRLLEINGFSRKHVPLALGGCLDWDSLAFQRVRQRRDMEMLVHAPSLPHLCSGVSLSMAMPNNNAQIVCNPKPNNLSLEEYRRKRNAIYGRRFYKKRKIETLALQEHVQSLRRENQKLKRQNQQLEDFMYEAELVVKAQATSREAFENPFV